MTTVALFIQCQHPRMGSAPDGTLAAGRRLTGCGEAGGFVPPGGETMAAVEPPESVARFEKNQPAPAKTITATAIAGQSHMGLGVAHGTAVEGSVPPIAGAGLSKLCGRSGNMVRIVVARLSRCDSSGGEIASSQCTELMK